MGKWPLLDYWWVAAVALFLLILLGCEQQSSAPTPQYITVMYSDGRSWEAMKGCLGGYQVAVIDRGLIYLLDAETAQPMHC